MEATTSNLTRATPPPPLGPSGQSLLSSSSSQAITTSTTIINAPSGGITVSSSSTSALSTSTTSSSSPATGIGVLSPAIAGPTAKSTVGHHIPSDILDDLASRFIINVPDDERNNLIRICFQIELAHWFYLDFFCSIEEKKLVPCGIKQFATHLFYHIPFLRTHLSGLDKILEDWKEYKLSVPTYGAILLSEDLKHVLLVQSYWAKSSWGFPKGKVNEHEDPIHCATREVFEETGYDITGLIIPNDYIEAVINYQYTRLYLVRNVPLQTLFAPRTRKEIKCCEWFPVDSLPTNKNDVISKTNLGINPNSFFMIIPFIKRLKKWVNDNRSGIELNIIGATLSLSAVATAVQQQQLQHQLQQQQQIPPLSATATIATAPTATTTAAATATLLAKCNSNRKNDIKSINGNNALNINSNNIKNNYVIGCNVNKRQRHKSMGDIDGIKINITNNSNYNTKTFGTKSNITTPNIANDLLYNDNHSIVKRERYLKTSSRKQLFNNNINSNNNNINNTIINNNNNSISSYGNNSYVNFNNFIRQQSNSLDINTNKLNMITTTTTNNNNNNLIRNSQHKIANNKYNNNNNNNNKPKSISNSTKIQTTTAHNNNVSKVNPNLDSWTSFTFTKNFIANVFC